MNEVEKAAAQQTITELTIQVANEKLEKNRYAIELDTVKEQIAELEAEKEAIKENKK